MRSSDFYDMTKGSGLGESRYQQGGEKLCKNSDIIQVDSFSQTRFMEIGRVTKPRQKARLHQTSAERKKDSFAKVYKK